MEQLLIIIFFPLSLAGVLPLLTLSNMIHNGWQKSFLQPQHPYTADRLMRMCAGTEPAACLIIGKLTEGGQHHFGCQALQQQIAEARRVRNIAFVKRQQLCIACSMLATADFFANLARAQVNAAVDSVDGRRFAYARRSAKAQILPRRRSRRASTPVPFCADRV